MADVVDDDTEQAIVTLWQQQGSQLSQVFKTPPRTGRQKSTEPGADVQQSGPYAVLDCQLERRDNAAVGAWIDRRRVTITAYGTRADVVKAAGVLRTVFKLSTTLVYPSGAKFISWRPEGDVKIEEDAATKAGRDVWKATLTALVASTRLG